LTSLPARRERRGTTNLHKKEEGDQSSMFGRSLFFLLLVSSNLPV
jgi:hypothetical protein